MSTVLVALDNSLSGRALIAGARALALLLGAEMKALHVRVDGEEIARQSAEAAVVQLDTTTGSVVDRLVEAGGSGDVVALALGVRASGISKGRFGNTAAGVATALGKPVLIVPCGAEPKAPFRRVLVPIEGTAFSSLAPRAIFKLAPGAEVDAVALHVYDENSAPSFTDQPQHEQPAWEREFLQRYCPWGLGTIRLETRTGRPGDVIPKAASECDCDLIALGWSQDLSAGRAPVVRETLERSAQPVLLVPLQLAPEGSGDTIGAGFGAGDRRFARSDSRE